MELTRRLQPPTEDPARQLAYGIAQDVYDLRTAQGISQSDLAEQAGLRQPRISQVESAAGSPPTLSVLLRIAQALGVQLVIRLEKDPGDTL